MALGAGPTRAGGTPKRGVPPPYGRGPHPGIAPRVGQRLVASGPPVSGRLRAGELGRHAILAVDPGGTTGVAACHVQLYPTVRETLERGMLLRKSVEVRGTWLEQAEELAGIWDRFVFAANVEGGIALDDCHLVFENYLPDPRRMGAGATDLTPVWVAAAFAGMRREPQWQTPAQAKGYATNERLRSWGLWVRGSAHERDAWRHVACKVNQLVP